MIMRTLLIILLSIFVSLSSYAHAKKANQKNFDIISTNIQNNVLPYLAEDTVRIQKDIEKTIDNINRIKDRKFVKRMSSADAENILKSYASIAEIHENKSNIIRKLRSSGNNNKSQTCLLALDMIESLYQPYDEMTNAQFIEKQSVCKGILKDEVYDNLVRMINDYNYYMFELARVFEAYNNSKKDLRPSEWNSIDDYMLTLLKNEDAEYLFDVPYTHDMLHEFIHFRGDLPENLKSELYRACPDAFSDLK